MNYKIYSHRFAEEILNSKIGIKIEIEEVVKIIEPKTRSALNKEFKNQLTSKGWTSEVRLGDSEDDVSSKVDFLKDRVAIEVAFTNPSYLGIDLLKFQVMSYSNPQINRIDVGVYIVTTTSFQKKYFKCVGSTTFDRVVKYLPHLRSAIQVPIWVIGLIE